ncbi:hypothetical protein Scep_017190 [Stephania cephalantha]|uniref:TMEM205-like domain-containing protein n=1 Tax=Stephania cephalantha TaxID=152367 RepID=A0AAP0IP63_9MAGN
MMNLLGLAFVLSSLVTASIFSPSPSTTTTTTTTDDAKKQGEELMVVKEGGRVIMVEYEREGPETHDTHHHHRRHHHPHPTQQKQEEGTAHSLLDEKLDAERRLVGGITEEIKSVLPDHEQKWHPRELICDAFGKCKHRLAGAFRQAKDKITEKAHRVEDEAKGIGGAVKDKTEEITHQAAGQAKQRAVEVTHRASDAVKEKTKELAHEIESGAEKARESTHKITQQAEEGAKRAGEAVKQRAQENTHQAKQGAKQASQVVKQKADELIPEAEQRLEQLIEIAKHKSKDIAEDAKTAHQALWDERSLQRKATGLFKEAAVNITQYIKHRIESTVNFASLHTNSAMEFVHILGFSIAYGVSIWVTFISSHVLGGALPHQQLAMVQSKIYPVYFRTVAACISSALLAHCVIKRNLKKAEAMQTSNLFVVLLFIIFNMLYLEPRATKVMFERMKLEKEEGSSSDERSRGGDTCDGGDEEQRRVQIGEMNRRLKKLNRVSSVLNVISLMGLSCHLVYLTHFAIMPRDC